MKITLWFIWLVIRAKPLRFILLWISTLWVFTYLTNFGLFGFIWTNPVWSFWDKLSFMLDSFTNILSNITDIRVISLVVFSFVTTVNLCLMWLTIKRKSKVKRSKASTFGSVGALVGSHCVACGGSFLAPFVTALAGSGAYFSAARVNTAIAISVGINLVAIIFVGYATLKLANQEKNLLLQSEIV